MFVGWVMMYCCCLLCVRWLGYDVLLLLVECSLVGLDVLLLLVVCSLVGL